MDRGAPDFAYNTIKYNPLGSADFVNPNFDVAYLESWFAVDDRTAVILEVPEVKDRAERLCQNQVGSTRADLSEVTDVRIRSGNEVSTVTR